MKITFVLGMLLVGIVVCTPLAGAQEEQSGILVDHLYQFGNGAAVREVDGGNVDLYEKTRVDYPNAAEVEYSIYLGQDTKTKKYRVIVAFWSKNSVQNKLAVTEKKNEIMDNTRLFIQPYTEAYGIKLAKNYALAFNQYRLHLGQQDNEANVGIIIPATYAHGDQK